MTHRFDVIVAGSGGFGSSCLFHLATRGVNVLGLDRFPAGHSRGSSHGDTRIIRQAYFEHADYVPLLQRAYVLWRDLEDWSQRKLLETCGLFLAGPPHSEPVTGTRLAAEKHQLTLEEFSTQDSLSELQKRFPGFRFPDGFDAVYEPAGGFLHVEDCVRSHIDLACRAGGTHQSGETIVSWESDGRTVRVRTESTEFEAAVLILTPGAWSSDLLSSIPGFPALKVLRKTQHWHRVRSRVYDVSHGGCGFLFEMPYGVFYGFPSIDGQLLKLAEHSGGELISSPLQVDQQLKNTDEEPIVRFLNDVMPDVAPETHHHSVCLYTMSPDGHFIVDRHPQFSNVLFGAGFSGHGFKFTAPLGEALAELAIGGQSTLSIDFLGLSRFQT